MIVQPSGTQSSSLESKSEVLIESAGLSYRAGPEAYSFNFNSDGLCYRASIGYPVDASVGNTQGLGGLPGLFLALGKPNNIFETRSIKGLFL